MERPKSCAIPSIFTWNNVPASFHSCQSLFCLTLWSGVFWESWDCFSEINGAEREVPKFSPHKLLSQCSSIWSSSFSCSLLMKQTWLLSSTPSRSPRKHAWRLLPGYMITAIQFSYPRANSLSNAPRSGPLTAFPQLTLAQVCWLIGVRGTSLKSRSMTSLQKNHSICWDNESVRSDEPCKDGYHVWFHRLHIV